MVAKISAEMGRCKAIFWHQLLWVVPRSARIFDWRQKAALTIPSLPLGWVTLGDQIPCKDAARRIVIFQRSSGSSLRRFKNIYDVASLAQNYTSGIVQILTLNDNDDVVSQIQVFRHFDILITPYGSHLANLIEKKNSVIEIDLNSWRLQCRI